MGGQATLRARVPGPRLRTLFGLVRLDLDDLQAIERYLSTLGDLSVTSSAYEGEANTMQAFVDIGATSLPDVNLTVRPSEKPWLRALSLDVRRLSTYLPEPMIDDVAALGVRAQVEGVLLARRRRIATFFYRFGAILTSLVFVPAAAGYLILRSSSGADRVPVWVLIAAFVGMVLSLTFSWSVMQRSVVLLVRSKDRPSWWTRNRDNLAVQVVGGLVVLVVGIAIGLLIS